ncbi:MAG: alcohol dehydrogenase catalytic domain-containing protein [Pseudomonadota bacterium]
MKGLVYLGPHASEYREVAEPVPGEGEVVVRIEAVGLCGSDMHAYVGHDDRRPGPLILGHEPAGVVEETGERVAINPLVTCGACEDCTSGRENLCTRREIISLPPREGAFAERVAMPRRNLTPVPDHVPFAQAALTEPLACGWHALRLGRRTAFKAVDETRVVVLGGGAIGIGAALCAQAQGYRHITISEPNAERRALLQPHGDFIVRDPDATMRKDGGADLVIDAAGFASTRAAASALTRPGGTIVHIGLGSGEGGIDARRLTLQEITFAGAYTYTPQDFAETAHALFDGRLGDTSWAEQRPLSDGPRTLQEMAGGRIPAPKVVFIP